MTQYLLLVHGNATSSPSAEEWTRFFAAAQQSGQFKGGSELGNRMILGDERPADSSRHIAGFMRFDSEDKQALLDLLEQHPVVVHGGSIELCEMPESR